MDEPNPSRLTETFELLSHPYRRYTLYCLTNESEKSSVDSLTTAITAWAREQTGAGTSPDRSAVETALRHTHLPKLADRGILSFHPSTGVVERRETDGIDRFLAETARIDGYTPLVASD